jgi:hypothetical protein
MEVLELEVVYLSKHSGKLITSHTEYRTYIAQPSLLQTLILIIYFFNNGSIFTTIKVIIISVVDSSVPFVGMVISNGSVEDLVVNALIDERLDIREKVLVTCTVDTHDLESIIIVLLESLLGDQSLSSRPHSCIAFTLLSKDLFNFLKLLHVHVWVNLKVLGQ